MGSKEIYNPESKYANIHGMVGINGKITCKTQNNNMCTGCCEALHITDAKNQIVEKPMGVKCEFQKTKEGCDHLLKGLPEARYWRCAPYHCSKDIRNLKNPSKASFAEIRIRLSNAAALNNEEITHSQHNKNLITIFGKIRG